MSASRERAGLQEQLGQSINASSLSTKGRGADVETPLLRVAAVGAAALHIHHGADREGLPVAAVVSRPGHRAEAQDIIAAELATELAHIRFGLQHHRIPRAAQLFAAWMAHRARFATLPDRDELLPRLSARAMHEWLSDRCTRCGGTGRLEVAANGALVRGQGRMKRNAVFRACPAHQGCGGTGRPAPSHTARRVALGLDLARYEAEGWGRNVTAAIQWLTRDLGRLNRPLTVQLERSRKRV